MQQQQQHNNNIDDTSGINGDSVSDIIARIVASLSYGNALTLHQEKTDLINQLKEYETAFIRAEHEMNRLEEEREGNEVKMNFANKRHKRYRKEVLELRALVESNPSQREMRALKREIAKKTNEITKKTNEINQAYASHTRLEEELESIRSELGQAEDNAVHWENIAVKTNEINHAYESELGRAEDKADHWERIAVEREAEITRLREEVERLNRST